MKVPPYEDLLRKLRLSHLKGRPEDIREAVLRELGLFEFRDDPRELECRAKAMLDENMKRLDKALRDLGRLIQQYVLKRNN